MTTLDIKPSASFRGNSARPAQWQRQSLSKTPALPQSERHRIAHRASFQAFQTADALGAADIFRDPGNINETFRFTAVVDFIANGANDL